MLKCLREIKQADLTAGEFPKVARHDDRWYLADRCSPQRRLVAAGTSFGELVNEYMHAIARRMLAHTKADLARVANVPTYAGSSAFARVPAIERDNTGPMAHSVWFVVDWLASTPVLLSHHGTRCNGALPAFDIEQSAQDLLSGNVELPSGNV